MQDLLAKLISFPTIISDAAAANDALDFIEKFVQERGLTIIRGQSGEFRSLLAATKSAKTSPKILLAAHLDVVPATEDMFTITEKNGELCGRGVFDMKFGIAVFLQIIEELKDELAKYDLGFLITTDEEIGGQNGVKYWTEQGLSPEVVVLPDGGDNWQIETLAKGIWHLSVSTYGTAGHASRPWEGDSASDHMLDLLQDIRKLFGQQPELSTLNIGKIEGGEAANQIPSDMTAMLDIRYISEPERQKLEQQIADLCKKHNGSSLAVLTGLPSVNDFQNNYLQTFAKLVETHAGVPCKETTSYGSNDGRFFTARDIPTIVCRPPGKNAHGPNESMKLSDIETYKMILQEFLQYASGR
jgi:acetylornithine deacetylase/succinyl-diaminopimelate desuccinylase-like protein